jgi:hypothetical protein
VPRPVNRKKTGRKADQPAALRDIISLASAGETERGRVLKLVLPAETATEKHRKTAACNFSGNDSARHPFFRRQGTSITALITGAIINSENNRVYRGDAHVQWCYDRYRSYRASDNTFQPYKGPRQQCYSPY